MTFTQRVMLSPAAAGRELEGQPQFDAGGAVCGW